VITARHLTAGEWRENGEQMFLWACGSVWALHVFSFFLVRLGRPNPNISADFSWAFFRTGTPVPFSLFHIRTSRLGLFVGLGQSQPCHNPTKVGLKRANPGENENKIVPRNKSTEFGSDLVAHDSSRQKPLCHHTPTERYGAVTVSVKGEAPNLIKSKVWVGGVGETSPVLINPEQSAGEPRMSLLTRAELSMGSVSKVIPTPVRLGLIMSTLAPGSRTKVIAISRV